MSGAITYPPPGRERLDASEVEARYVLDPAFATSTTRSALWQQWLAGVQLLNTAVPIAAAWLSGSFVSSKLDPDDVDSVFWIRDDHLDAAAADPSRAPIVDAFGRGRGHLETYTGLRIDSYVSRWRPNPRVSPRDFRDIDYHRARGYWDDFWLRHRSGAKTDAPVFDDALPRRGYVEVVIDGYG